MYSLTYTPAPAYTPTYTLDIHVNKSTCTLKGKEYMIKDDDDNNKKKAYLNFACIGPGEGVLRCYVSTCLIKSKLPSTRCKIYVILEMIFER